MEAVCRLLRKICKSGSLEQGLVLLRAALEHFNGKHHGCEPTCSRKRKALPPQVVSLIQSVCETVLRAPARFLHGFTTNMVENFNSSILAFSQKRTYEPRAYRYKIMMAFLAQTKPDWKRIVMREVGIAYAPTANANIDAALLARQRHRDVADSSSRYTKAHRMRQLNEIYKRLNADQAPVEPGPELTTYGEPHTEPRPATATRCSCKTGCGRQCGCRKAGRACAARCGCTGCKNNGDPASEPKSRTCGCQKGCAANSCACFRLGERCGASCTCCGCANWLGRGGRSPLAHLVQLDVPTATAFVCIDPCETDPVLRDISGDGTFDPRRITAFLCLKDCLYDDVLAVYILRLLS